MEIVFLDTGKSRETDRTNGGMITMLTVLVVFFALIALALIICIKLENIMPTDTDCCSRPLELNFDFDLDGSRARCGNDTVQCQ